jgi:hypothetical protein
MLDISVAFPQWIVVSDFDFSEDHIYCFNSLLKYFFWLIFSLYVFVKK